MKSRLFAVWFWSPTQSDQYEKLAAVLRHTASKFNPDWTIDVRKIQPSSRRSASGAQSHADNNYKLEAWAREVREAPDGERLLIVDADTFVVGELDSLWDHPFDVAYTYRENAERFPLNGGVIAVRVGYESRRFFDAWVAQDAAFFNDAALHEPYQRKYGGMNQASLGYLIDRGDFNLAALPCGVWNCEDTNWATFGEHTRIVHVKSALRLAVFSLATNRHVRKLAALWKKNATQIGYN